MTRHAIIIGAGLAGVTTAWMLIQRGWSPIVIDAHEAPARGASYANAGANTPSEPEPWNGPGVAGQLARSLFDPASAMKLRPSALPGLIGWGLKFLTHSTPKRHAAAALANFQLARRSLTLTQAARTELDLDYDCSAKGTLKLCRDQAGLEKSAAAAEALGPAGLEFERVDAAGCVRLEPMLGAIERDIAGGVYFPHDESGDARMFIEALAERCEAAGAEFQWNTKVEALRDRAGRIIGVDTDKEVIEAEAVILAAGHESWKLLRPHGLHLPVRPVKGYSMTFSMDGLTERPAMPVVDDKLHAIATPLGDRLRVAGTAEIAGEADDLPEARLGNLRHLVKSLYPDLALDEGADGGQPWAGFRPMSADGRPFIGETRASGLWLATGYGHLGWTMAMGAADLLAAQLDGETPAIDPAPFAAGRV